MATAGDEDLVREVASGRTDALSALIDRHRSGLLGWFARRLSSREDAEEASQDVFLRLSRGAPGFRERRRFRPWFFAIARNVLRDRLRTSTRIPTVALPADLPDRLGVYRTDPGTGELREALAALPRPYRAALALRYLGGLTYREAAEELGLTERGFETRLARAKGLLREELGRRRPDLR